MARKDYKRPTIPKRNDSKSNYAKNGIPGLVTGIGLIIGTIVILLYSTIH